MNENISLKKISKKSDFELRDIEGLLDIRRNSKIITFQSKIYFISEKCFLLSSE